ncbi:MAG: hypothetical protein UU47_C0022G0013 [candidate division TM6 bacterium GW2011_GWE2_41_16]|nr:MAG: hypothetical protein UU47_C0022G0013 [candidate division TM6 bacterium GW2011_GWE2_41_16]
MSQKKVTLDSENVSITEETLQTIEWLVEYDQEILKALLLRTYQKRCAYEINQMQQLDPQETVLKLLSLVDILHQEIIEESAAQHVLQNALIPTIKQLDTSSFGKKTVEQSTHKALTKKTKMLSKENKKAILCRELLRRWKPTKKQSPH